ncbi:MAG: GTPase domain-containing protein [Candidatus Sigynarchaeota archaeon]
MERKKTIEIDPKVYQKLLALKMSGETIEAVVARLVEASSHDAGNAKWHVPCKIVVLGPPASGKSMLVKSFFENKDPRLILSDFLLPTKDTEEITYDWLDLKVTVVDVGHDDYEQVTAGKQPLFLSNANEIIYVIDVGTWTSQKTLIATEIATLLKARAQLAPDAGVTILAHKKDTKEKAAIEVILNEIDEMLGKMKNDSKVRIEATSLLPKCAIDAFRVFRNILLKHSSLLRQALLPGFSRT